MSGSIIIIGAGFAGVWSALSARRLIKIHGQSEAFKVTVIAPQSCLIMRPRLYEANPSNMSQELGPLFEASEAAGVLGPELGPGPRPVITQALDELGIELRLGSPITAVESEGVQLASGEIIETMTTIWTAGVRATPLTQKIPGPKDKLSRLHVDRYLRAVSSERVFATGDAAYAASDSNGHYALMSCQHALQLGRVSGYNAAADLLGVPLFEYKQESYNCCLDLGAWGAVVTSGWDRKCWYHRRDTFPHEGVSSATITSMSVIIAVVVLPIYIVGRGRSK
ncbi:hypothetical protein BDP81DRAFT_487529 [Colletotrichum phormii]|uniref:FAD/NAD(P)-binding domain-containing protein n=1 Tax=Colletotrichum phormii TaxID=359342 RepID=A0AAJ0A702_9PEZI|nr:uncharacterized protein BDP81DRAFT_487529 [Colletotrichum phormii]KAK1656182.1 hypothetical protein BDP81DRAFT_487529 [Colletotrichum phormii]